MLYFFQREFDVLALGVVGLLVARSFDTTKTRLQNPVIYSKYKSTLDATVHGPLTGRCFTPRMWSLMFPCSFHLTFVFSSYKFFMKPQLDDPTSVPSLTPVSLAGTGCGIVTS
ncbi:hypothetical protein HD554DRAFT_2110484 [Boletus coccyginus]|nr:hypothetical protein HD554DRAFT_2110484 [Boletus coccyginus]